MPARHVLPFCVRLRARTLAVGRLTARSVRQLCARPGPCPPRPALPAHSECDVVLLPDVWVQHSKGAINKCLKCKRKGGFKKALGLGRELKDLAARKVDVRTIIVSFPCELCWIKQKNLKYCVRHGHDERKVLVHEPDPGGLGDETMSHADYEKVCQMSGRAPGARAAFDGILTQQMHPDADLNPGHDAPISRMQSADDHDAAANKSRHGDDEVGSAHNAAAESDVPVRAHQPRNRPFAAS